MYIFVAKSFSLLTVAESIKKGNRKAISGNSLCEKYFDLKLSYVNPVVIGVSRGLLHLLHCEGKMYGWGVWTFHIGVTVRRRKGLSTL